MLSRWKTTPPDMMKQACQRVRLMSLSIAAIWAIALLVNNPIAALLGHQHTGRLALMWPMPGNLIAAIGLVASLATYWVVKRLKPEPGTILNLGLGLQVVTAALVAMLMNWYPAIGTSRISWLCLIILVQPAIVPVAPMKTLLVSLLIATMDPLGLWMAHLRGVRIDAEPLLVLWYVLPNYISVALALIPSHIITSMARQVSQARELGSYQLGELLGRGGMGEIYAARHRMLARPAAIKLIRPETLGAGNPATARLMVQRFHREAQAAALLRSPHTISLYDFGVTDEGTFYYVMELLEGFDLETLVRQFGPVPDGRAVFLLRSACRSLGEAHARGLIHRDIKPSNIYTCRLGLNVDFVKVLDFGLVKTTQADSHENSTMITNPDITTGTPAFMAPEMALGETTINSKVDIYALGCVAYWLLTGKLVFEADTPVKMMLRHIQSAPVPPSEVSEIEIPPEMDRIILQCLSKKPADRPDAMQLSRALAAIEPREPWPRERAEEWWQTHLPVQAPFTELKPKTALGEVHADKQPLTPAAAPDSSEAPSLEAPLASGK
jgi:eukaryotic-like serine/threonine-protein kinase